MSEEFLRGFYDELEKIAAITDYIDPKTLGGAAVGAGLGAAAGGVGGYYAGEKMKPGAGGKGALIGALGGGALGGVGSVLVGHHLAAGDYAKQMAQQQTAARGTQAAAGGVSGIKGLQQRAGAVGAEDAAQRYAQAAGGEGLKAQALEQAQSMYEQGLGQSEAELLRERAQEAAGIQMLHGQRMGEQAAQAAQQAQKQKSMQALQQLLQSQSGQGVA